jgi:uncharacterized membrane protein YeaQ/YmgE (transglycosylase-associated protein family)
VVILDRPRHEAIIRECRETGCRIKLISDGDVAAAIEVAKAGAAADIMMGIGGTPEGEWLCNVVSFTVSLKSLVVAVICHATGLLLLGPLRQTCLRLPGTGVIAAAALKCMGGHLQGRLHPRNDEERKRAIAAGYDLDAILHTNDLAKGDQVAVPSSFVWAARQLPYLPQRLALPGNDTHTVAMLTLLCCWCCCADLLCSHGRLRWRPASGCAVFCGGRHHQQHGDAAPVRHR